MTKFLRDTNGIVRNLSTGRPSRELDVKRLMSMGKPVKYTCESTGEDLLEHLNEPLGPARPLHKTKRYKCQNCNQRTINRFRCHRCWVSFHRSLASED